MRANAESLSAKRAAKTSPCSPKSNRFYHRSTAREVLWKRPPPLVRFAANVPDELQRIVAKMLRKKKDERYQTMRDVLTDLRDLRENLKADEKLAASASRDSNATEIFRATTGDANIQTAETQYSFSRQIKRHKSLAAIVWIVLLAGAIALAYHFYAGAKPATFGAAENQSPFCR